MTVHFEARRLHMVDKHLARRGIVDARVLAAFRRVPREVFVPSDLQDVAYADAALPIGEGQTISQPYVVALTCAALALRGSESVLEVGTGSGYAAAVLSLLASKVFTVERIGLLANKARTRLSELGYANVEVACGDGSLGLPAHAAYDAIAVAAASPAVPSALLSQLCIGGRLVMPVGTEHDDAQRLYRVTRDGLTDFSQEQLALVHFVPLVGEQGCRAEDAWLRAMA